MEALRYHPHALTQIDIAAGSEARADRAGPGIQREQPRVRRRRDDPLRAWIVGGARLVVSDAPTGQVDVVAGVVLRVEAPALLAGDRIERDDVPVRRAEIDSVANLDRRRLEVELAAVAVLTGSRQVAGVEAPSHLQPGHIVGRDLCQRGIAIAIGRAAIPLPAKAAGKGQVRTFSIEMELRMQERIRLEAKLRDALHNQAGLFVFYQPIIEIETGRITAREALVRSHHPLRGWISPAEFVPIAETSGLVDALGLFVLNRACADAATCEDGARVAVNVSARQLGKGTLAAMVLTALVQSGLAPGRLEIEITETALLDDEADTLGDLRQLRSMGVRVALDDFGTGYSSLAHLRTFTFDKIKIDGSFVKDAVERPDCAAVVRAVADLGKRLGVTTVAEGVETQAQLDLVRSEGCTEVQGYLFGRPVPRAADQDVVEEIDRSEQSFDAARA